MDKRQREVARRHVEEEIEDYKQNRYINTKYVDKLNRLFEKGYRLEFHKNFRELDTIPDEKTRKIDLMHHIIGIGLYLPKWLQKDEYMNKIDIKILNLVRNELVSCYEDTFLLIAYLQEIFTEDDMSYVYQIIDDLEKFVKNQEGK